MTYLKVVLGSLSALVLMSLLSSCSSLHSAKSAASGVLSETDIESRMEKLRGVASAETNIIPTGPSKHAVLNIFLTTDNQEMISAIQRYGVRLMYINSSLPTPAIINETFLWAPGYGTTADSQAPRSQVVAAVDGVRGVSVYAGLPGSATLLEIASKEFDGGLDAAKIDPDDVPKILLSSCASSANPVCSLSRAAPLRVEKTPTALQPRRPD